MSIKLISLNIEGNKHLDNLVLPFLVAEKPEVVTLQEVFLPDVPKIEAAFYQYYYGVEEVIPEFFAKQDPNSMNRVLVWQVVEKDGQPYRFATTHFTWSMDGQTIDLQKQTYQSMKQILETFPDLVLTGDFNAPRGKEIFTNLATSYKDNIPAEVMTTIDNNLHKAKANIQFVVDGCFTSKEYRASNVKIVDGVSDHMAVVAEISRVD
jgi:endonuclease/exonuclease/phosphatase family metal-dependent hydrolase